MQLQAMIKEMNEMTQYRFQNLHYNKEELYINGIKAKHTWKYTQRQQAFALNMIYEHGVRATARILRLPRSTLQNWIRKYYIDVPRYPQWMDRWRRKKLKMRRIFKGY